MCADRRAIELSREDLRAVAEYAVACATPALVVVEDARPADARPRHAIEAARQFACGGPRTKATQVKHILGPAAHAAVAFELGAGNDVAVGAEHVERARALASDDVVAVLTRFPPAPGGGGRPGRLLRDLVSMLRWEHGGQAPGRS